MNAKLIQYDILIINTLIDFLGSFFFKFSILQVALLSFIMM